MGGSCQCRRQSAYFRYDKRGLEQSELRKILRWEMKKLSLIAKSLTLNIAILGHKVLSRQLLLYPSPRRSHLLPRSNPLKFSLVQDGGQDGGRLVVFQCSL